MMPLALGAAWAGLVVVVTSSRRPVTRVVALSPVRCSARRRASRLRRARRWLPTVVGAGLVAIFVGPVAGAAMATLIEVLRGVREARARRLTGEARAGQLPDAVDLLVVAGAAGFTARQGLAVVAERGPPTLQGAFRAVVGRLEAGEPLTDALPRLIGTIGEPARGMVRAILTAERDGVPIRALLGHLADDARRQRRHELEAAVRRLPVRLTFPIVCCCLPAFAVLTVVPLVFVGLERLGPVGA